MDVDLDQSMHHWLSLWADVGLVTSCMSRSLRMW
jgi:hypothetical protein